MSQYYFPQKIISLILIGLFSLIYNSYPDEIWNKLSNKENATFFQIQEAAISFYKTIKTGRKPGYKQYKRWENFARQRLNQNGVFDMSLNYKGWVEKQTRFSTPDTTSNDADWHLVGPVSSNNISGIGRLNCITFDPHNSDIIWVGAPTGGLWKSIDGGKTWSTNTDRLPNLGVSDIVIHPHNSNIMYIATGDKQRGSALSYGVMKSIDGGLTWNFTGLNPEVADKFKIGKLIIHPEDSDTLLCAVNKGIYKTVDAGLNWKLKESGDFFDLEVHPSKSNYWYASLSKNGVYRSTDSGETWSRLTKGLPLPGNDIGRIAIAVSESSPDIVYALYCQDRIGEGWIWGLYGLYRSINGGNNWTLQARAPNILGWETNGSGTGGQGGYALVLQVNPQNPNMLIAGSVNLWRSADAGVSWKGASFNTTSTIVHPDFHEVSYLPGSPMVVFACHDGGLHRSDDHCDSWTDLSSGLGIHQVYRIGLDKQNSHRFALGAQDNGSSLLNTDWRIIGGGDGMECMIDYQNPYIIYSSSQFGNISISTNNGATRSPVFSNTYGTFAWTVPLIMDPFSSNTIYTASTAVFKSTDRGRSSTPISLQLSTLPIKTLKISSSDARVLIASDGLSIFCTKDGGSSWEELNNLPFPEYITDIAIHPLNPDILWATIGGYGRWNGGYAWLNIPYEIDKPKVFYSIDGGKVWSNISGQLPNVPANCLVVDPVSMAVYLGTDLGVFYSSSGTGDWKSFDIGLPNIIITELEIHQNSSSIFAATFGRGVWTSPLADDIVVLPPLSFNGELITNRSLLSTEYILDLNWVANPNNVDKNGDSTIRNYLIYEITDQKKILISEFNGNTFNYSIRGFNNSDINLTFGITAKNFEGVKSNFTYFTISPLGE